LRVPFGMTRVSRGREAAEREHMFGFRTKGANAFQSMTMFERMRTPFWRGFRAATIYYGATALVFLLLKVVLPLRDDVYIFFVFLPTMLLSGIIWAVVSFIASFFRVWPRGALIVHVIVILSAWWVASPKPPVFPQSATNPVRGELMPTFNTIDDQRKFLSNYQKELQSWSVPAEERDIETEFGKTHIISFGNPQGRPLVLLHWFYSNSTEWKYMAPFLQERCRVYAIDIIGDMGKSYAYNPPKSEKEVSQWFIQVLDSLSLNKVSICGHSNGGFQAMLIAQQNPNRIEKLILLAPAAGFKPFSLKFFLVTFGTAFFPKDIILESFKNAGTLQPNLWSNEMTEMLTLSFRVAANQLRVYPREFGDDELKAIKVPTLLMLGKEEMIYSPEECAERASRLLPKSKVIMLSNCGHAIPYDAPKEASEAIDSFLSDVDQNWFSKNL
jgi:pimeloyl-ACP methyl ester carboxylesterase